MPVSILLAFLLVTIAISVISGIPVKTIDKTIKKAHRIYVLSHNGTRSQLDGGRKVEGDIIVTKQEYKRIKSGHPVSKRNAIRDERYRWTNNVVNYEIPADVFDSRTTAAIQSAIQEWSTETCLVFRNVGSQNVNKITFIKDDGCYSWVGMQTGRQAVSIGDGCGYHNIVVHEIGHAIGYQHEQTRPDRDNFVTVHFSNIRPDAKSNFDKETSTQQNTFSIPYDYRSVMHYGRKFFSINGKDTITTKDIKYIDIIGTSPKLSFLDVKMANIMLKCADKCSQKSCPNNGFLDKNCKCKCAGSRNPTKECGSAPPPATKGPTPAPNPPTNNPPTNNPPTNNPPTNNPPTNNPPTNNPPTNNPPTNNPPTNNPPTNNPPTNNPPTNNPPTNNPPTNNPPTINPPTNNPPTNNPPTINPQTNNPPTNNPPTINPLGTTPDQSTPILDVNTTVGLPPTTWGPTTTWGIL